MTSEVDAAQALLACVSGAYEYGVQDGEFVAAYVTPTGPIHRAIVVLQALGIVARPRPQEVMPPALAERIAAAEVERLRGEVAEDWEHNRSVIERTRTERDAARAALTALVADLRALLVTWTEKPLDPWDWDEPADDLRALLDRHAAEEGP